jgi:CRISPR-associated protein Cas1
MKHHLNTLFVTTPGAYLKKDGQAVAVTVEREVKLRVPLHNLGGIVTFGSIGASPALLGACAKSGVAVTFLTEYGGMVARVTGFDNGNVLLRRAQYRWADDDGKSAEVARMFVAAKIANCRNVLLRTARDHPDAPGRDRLAHTAERLSQSLDDVQRASTLDALRGLEGDAARSYFAVFNALITSPADGFVMNGRTRRPPLDPVNALLSFLYVMLTHDARAACEAVGLDPQVGFLHRDRPGRPGLALDLVEELRPLVADRVALSLINRRQIEASGFVQRESGGYEMTDETRKAVLVAYQKRKQETLLHPFLRETTTLGLIIHVQARLLARHLRGELDAYPPFIGH